MLQDLHLKCHARAPWRFREALLIRRLRAAPGPLLCAELAHDDRIRLWHLQEELDRHTWCRVRLWVITLVLLFLCYGSVAVSFWYL